jgi:hypothetical protein
MSNSGREAVLDRLDKSNIDTAVLERLAEIAEAVTAAKANDPSTLLREENAAVEAWSSLQADWLGHIFARRYGAAMKGLDPLDLRAATAETVELGRTPFEKAAYQDREYAPMLRRVGARALLDQAPAMPSGVASELAGAAWLLNLGEEGHPLTKRYRPRGTKAGIAKHNTLNTVIISAIYYHAGFHEMALPDAAAKVLPKDYSGKVWRRLEHWRDRHPDLQKVFEYNRQQGQEACAAGRTYDEPLILSYDRAMQEIYGEP